MQIALTIAGSDSGGGAGIQADLKTFARYGLYGTSVITAITAQNTRGVYAIHPVPIDVVDAQLAAIADDLPPHAFKSGMLGTASLVQVVAARLPDFGGVPYVLDPVMVATSGDRLLEPAAEAELRDRLLPLATLVTPNLDEASILVGYPVTNPSEMERAGRTLLDLGAHAALIKGGHLPGDAIVDVLVTPSTIKRFAHRRVPTTSTHGTGCTLSAAITAGLARRRTEREATGRVDAAALTAIVADALDYLHRAIATAPRLGHGHGPVNHSA